ncbi:MAG: Heat-inducible transcription repressor HrcA [Chloroflexi bacterium ADurb.Bin325]|nr:MAG: Heat-inducible transcription repressor HrcA [Chloroflexi bacterium ADurb.Bin325]
MSEMTTRRQAVLGLVIRSYIERGQPVGSKSFVTSYGLDISPATIRNEMAALEEMGYLTHPHTSAGRVPTDQGYRYFVEHLLGETELPLPEQLMIRHQFHQARLELDQWVRLAVAVLAHTTRKAALATPPRARESKFKHVELISLRDTLVLLVLVLMGGAVKQQMLTLDEPVEQEALSRLSNELNDHYKGLTAGQISARSNDLPALGRQISHIIGQVIQAVDRQGEDFVYRDGLLHMLGEPEFAESQQVRGIVQTFEGPSLSSIVSTAAPVEVGGVQVLIGGEGRWQEFADLTLVLSRYGVEGGASGLLGVVGPLRMTYDRTIGAVRYVSQLMSDLVSDWHDTDDAADGQ